jgi:hypothetical protein
MLLHSASTSPPRPSPKEAIPYSSAALRQDLERLRGIWEDCQATRDRKRNLCLPDGRLRPGCLAFRLYTIDLSVSFGRTVAASEADIIVLDKSGHL